MNSLRTNTVSRSTRLAQVALVAVGAVVSLVPLPNASLRAQTAACEPGTGSAFLEANDVRAKILNSGHLFWGSHPNIYEVPSGEGVQAVFVQMLVLTGRVDGELRGSVARPQVSEVWPGPIDEATGLPPAGSCQSFDRIYNVAAADLAALEAGEAPAPDLRDWPTGLGAPTLDSQGEPIDISSAPLSERMSRTIDLDAGERPAIIGDQIVWWIMNDVGNKHTVSDGPPLGVEIGASAFAFDEPGPLRHTTFYRYRIRYLGTSPLDSLHIGIYQWPEIGSFGDDYLGADSTLGMAYAYNADDLDENYYGPAPPALGLDMVRGPLVRGGQGPQPRAGFTAVVREGIGSSADAYRAEHFEDGATFSVPFELWNIGTTPDDASDDVRLIPAICEWVCLGGTLEAYESTGRRELTFDIGDDHRASGGLNDPYSDLIYWGVPSDASPGQAGYDAFFAGTGEWAEEVFADMVLINWNGGEYPGPYDADMPEVGTVFRIVTNKYPTEGESFSLSTAGLAPTALSTNERKERLDTIGIVPNPFYAFSDYQVSPEAFEARLTNIPAGATVRVFTLSGSLVATLHQESDGVLRWDLTNRAGKSLANGMYLIHVDVPDVGERILKFAIVKANSVTGS